MTPELENLQTYLRQMDELKRSTHEQNHLRTMEAYLLEHGRAFGSAALTSEERAYVLGIVDAYGRTLPIKQCFSNAQLVLLMADSAQRCTYHEGYVVRHAIPFPIHHAWLTLNDKVVDLTLRNAHGTKRRRERLGHLVAIGTFAEPLTYFGAPFDRDDIRRRICTTREAGSMLDDWKRGWPYLVVPTDRTAQDALA